MKKWFNIQIIYIMLKTIAGKRHHYGYAECAKGPIYGYIQRNLFSKIQPIRECYKATALHLTAPANRKIEILLNCAHTCNDKSFN